MKDVVLLADIKYVPNYYEIFYNNVSFHKAPLNVLGLSRNKESRNTSESSIQSVLLNIYIYIYIYKECK